jgi:hypothetical protein
MKRDAISAEDRSRIKALTAEIVNLAYHERYDASAQAAQHLVALTVDLEAKYGLLPTLLALRADYVTSSSEREGLLHAAYEEAGRRGDSGDQAWIAYSLASHYVDAMRDDTQGSLWLSLAEERVDMVADELAADDLARLRGILNARQGRKTKTRRDRRAAEQGDAPDEVRAGQGNRGPRR